MLAIRFWDSRSWKQLLKGNWSWHCLPATLLWCRFELRDWLWKGPITCACPPVADDVVLSSSSAGTPCPASVFICYRASFSKWWFDCCHAIYTLEPAPWLLCTQPPWKFPFDSWNPGVSRLYCIRLLFACWRGRWELRNERWLWWLCFCDSSFWIIYWSIRWCSCIIYTFRLETGNNVPLLSCLKNWFVLRSNISEEGMLISGCWSFLCSSGPISCNSGAFTRSPPCNCEMWRVLV